MLPMNAPTFARRFIVSVVLVFTFLIGNAANAHRTGESYIYLNVADTALSGRYEIPLVDLAKILDIDTDDDSVVSQAELDASRDMLFSHFDGKIGFQVGATESAAKFTGVEFLPTSKKWIFLTFDVASSGDTLPETIQVQHTSSWDEADPNHRVLVLIESNTRTGVKGNEARHSLIFGQGAESAELKLSGASGFTAFMTFVWHGIHHLLIGFDHIAFILVLVLPSVLVVVKGRWEGAPIFGAALWNIVKIATVFTIAHSITLVLAALGIVRLPPGPVEALIAISIVIAAAFNIFSTGRQWVYMTIFALGLLHGLGFANVLAPLGMEPINLIPSLIGFNVGVEIGQLLILIPPFIVLFAIRNWSGYQPFILKGGSAILIIIALYWFALRSYGILLRLLN